MKVRTSLPLLLKLSIVAAFITFNFSIVSAQTNGRDLIVKQDGDYKTLPQSSKRWALIIGVDEYVDKQISSLSGASNDAKQLANALVQHSGFPADQVVLLSSTQPAERWPTRVNILRRFSNLVSVVPKDGLLLIAFAGHGIEREGQAYLLPSDAQISNDIGFLEDTAVSVSRIKSRVRAIGVQQVLFLLDACRNDPVGRADAPACPEISYLSPIMTP